MAEPSYIPRMTADLLTADELLAMDMPGKRTELVHGRLFVREPSGLRHGVIAAALTELLRRHVRSHDLGIVVAAETGFRLFTNPDTVRAADVAFIARSRVPNPLPTGFADIAPDLAVEVRSPGDRPGEVLAKVSDWLRAGSRLVWVLDPERSEARAYRADGSEVLRRGDDSLDGEDVVPGFSCSLSDILNGER